MTRFRGISETAPVEISIDRSLEIIAPPVPTLTIPDVPALNPGNGPITLPGATITYGSLPALSGIGIIILTPPLIISGPILLNPLPVGVVVDGTAQEGQTLSVTASSAIVSAQWQRLIGGSWVDVAGATHTVYTVQPDDIGRQMRVQIIGTDGLALTSGPSNAVRDAAGNQYVYETTAATSIESGMLQYVYGTAVGTTVAAGGQQNIYAGGFAAASTLDIGGIQIDWGYAHGTVVSGGTQFVWGTASHTTISGGQQFVEAGGLANETEIYPAGEQTVLTAGHASNTTVGGIQTVYGSADATTVSFGGLQRVHGQVGTTTVRHHSQQNIYADGTATDTTLHDGSVQIDWGMATNTIVGMNSTQYVWVLPSIRRCPRPIWELPETSMSERADWPKKLKLGPTRRNMFMAAGPVQEQSSEYLVARLSMATTLERRSSVARRTSGALRPMRRSSPAPKMSMLAAWLATARSMALPPYMSLRAARSRMSPSGAHSAA